MVTEVELQVQSGFPSLAQSQAPAPLVPTRRHVALDAARGFVMIYVCTEGFGLSYLKGGATATQVFSWFTHLQCEGFRSRELVYSAFMFMVQAALPFTLAR